MMVAASVVGAAADPAECLMRLLGQADAAHRFFKRFGHPHPIWGNGSLLSRAKAERTAIPVNLSSPAYLTALQRVAEGLALRRVRRQNS
jgi:hypothetical protein